MDLYDPLDVPADAGAGERRIESERDLGHLAAKGLQAQDLLLTRAELLASACPDPRQQPGVDEMRARKDRVEAA